MKVRYFVGDNVAQGTANGGFILSNKAGSFYYSNEESRYGGWFVEEKGELYRILSRISIPAPQVSQVDDHVYYVERNRNNVMERLFMPLKLPALVYNCELEADLIFDVKKIFDNRQWGRVYDISYKNKKTIIKFQKKNDSREANGEEFTFYVVINKSGKVLNNWEEEKYQFDEKRNSPPFSRFVFRAARFKETPLIITAGTDLDEAMLNNSIVCKDINKLTSDYRKHVSIDENLELSIARSALDKLLTEKGIMAGLPWFFKLWSRDETVSLKALMLLGEVDAAKKIIFERLESINDGKLPKIYGEQGNCSDSIGWLFKRCSDLLAHESLTTEEKEKIALKLVNALELNSGKNVNSNLITNEPSGTWMDTLKRPLAVEIQALHCAMYEFAYILTKNAIYPQKEKELREEIMEKFWSGKVLADCYGDYTARPNIFLAAYIYPNLLSREEWVACFKNVLPKLWLEWGGLAAVDKKSLLFVHKHTGEISKSYHNGDSWFWVNNIAAIAMHRIDKKAFKEYVHKIYETSRNEMLFRGCMGSCGELSSAEKLTSEGCPVQAWSAATFIELMFELGMNK